MRRQETQDLLALLRTLADPFDTLAFGALMRGPSVGLTEGRLLAITGALQTKADPPPAHDEDMDVDDQEGSLSKEEPGRWEDGPRTPFWIRTPPEDVADSEARSVLQTLQALRRLAATATPAALLVEAIERLNIRTALALRAGDRGGRAIANVDALVALAQPYRVRGLASFVATFRLTGRRPGRSPKEGSTGAKCRLHSHHP